MVLFNDEVLAIVTAAEEQDTGASNRGGYGITKTHKGEAEVLSPG